MKQRRPKRRRLEYVPTSYNNNDQVQQENLQRPQLNAVAKKPGVLSSRVPKFSREPLKERSEEEKMIGPSEEEAESHVPFCCAACACSQDRKERVETDRYHNFNWFQLEGMENEVWHRRCCHGQFELNSTKFTLPYVRANMLHEELMLSKESEKKKYNIPTLSTLEWVTKDMILNSYKTTKRQEAELYNNDDLETATQKLLTNREYQNNISHPYNDKKNEEIKPPTQTNSIENEGITVLDCFAGIGIGILALKRLKIKISTVIHVEHDKVATHVYRWNHDSKYNTDKQDDGIKHIYIDKFEKLIGCDSFNQEQKFKKLWKKANRKPIDFVIGGPPCNDYSMVNGYRKGTKGKQGNYLVQMGKFVRLLEIAQEKKFKREKLFFLAENVLLKGDDLRIVCDAFGISWDPIEFDAQYVSPTRRRRHFLTNIPLDADYPSCGYMWEDQCVESCLESGFVLPSQIVDPDTPAKANCFMASATRIDESQSLRMYIFDKNQVNGTRQYHGRPMKVSEREDLMGFPKDYVKAPVNHLFEKLMDVNDPFHSASWRESLDKNYHNFRGNYHKLVNHVPYKFSLFQLPKDRHNNIEYRIKMQMAPPTESKSPTFYDEEEYCKHLIGNSYSVPVVEALLYALVYYFPGNYTSDEFDYQYAWVKNNSNNVAVKIKQEEV